MYETNLRPLTYSGGEVTSLEDGSWRLSIPAGEGGQYRLAQLDDYAHLKRSDFPHTPPLFLKLKARASAPNLPGTWGFGLWNDPFSFSLGFGGGSRRLPALPSSAWFFFASPPNYLSFRDDLPAQGALAATFRSPPIPSPILGLGLPFSPMLIFPPTARWLRSLVRRFILQDSALCPASPTEWRTYSLKWESESVILEVDQRPILDTAVVPRGPLGLVVWIDNQYAALPPNGRLGYGTLVNHESAWIEVKDLEIRKDNDSG
jgi:hypothetical protein